MGRKIIKHVANLTGADISRIAAQIISQQEETRKEDRNWWKDNAKKYRVILVTIMIVVFFATEHYFHLKFAHKAAEVGIDCVADFLLFGSVE